MIRTNRKDLRRAAIGLEGLERRDLLSTFRLSSAFGNPDERTASTTTFQVGTTSGVGDPGIRSAIIAIT